MNTQKFDCSALAKVRALFEASDAVAATVTRFHDAAAQARAEAVAAEAKFANTLTDSDGAEVLALKDIADGAAKLAAIAGDPAERRRAAIETREMFTALADAFEAKGAAYRAAIALTRKRLGLLSAASIERGFEGSDSTQEATLSQARDTVRANEANEQETRYAAHDCRQRATWIAGGCDPMSVPSRCEVTADQFLKHAEAPLLEKEAA